VRAGAIDRLKGNAPEQVMEVKAALQSQYLAALTMLARAIEACPPGLWDDQRQKNRFWHIAYHALFYTHFYLQDREEDFTPWSGHRELYNFMGPLPWPPHAEPTIGEPYSKPEILEYLEFCCGVVRARVPQLDLGAASGFPWLPFGRLELQLYSIRHLQHHAGQLIERLRERTGAGVEWVGGAAD
jgi:hypothetical protein